MQANIFLSFRSLSFERKDNQILLQVGTRSFPFVEVHLAGEQKIAGAKKIGSSETKKLKYLSHTQTDNRLEIVQCSELIQVKTVFQAYEDCNSIRVYTEIKNISTTPQILEIASPFVYYFTGHGDSFSFTKFMQSHHGECQAVENSFEAYGLRPNAPIAQCRISFSNVGSQSTREQLPQGIISDLKNNAFTMFQIESNHSWCYEIGDAKSAYFAKDGYFYLYLGGVDQTVGDWCKTLQVGEIYKTLTVALAFGKSLNETLENVTKYRRHIAGNYQVDACLPPIFNEYMHLSWDCPTEENTAKYAPLIKKFGLEYYVIDCGWHDEVEESEIYANCGKWRESKTRFPSGVRATTDFIRSLGMKAGLWIEPEVLGFKNEEMLAYYDDDCFLQRHGKRIRVGSRYLLDFRAKKVVEYMSRTIQTMVEVYGADYIKFDYNQDSGVGTDYNADSAGEGLEESASAFLAWIDAMREKYPQVLFEACASGGMRMDYRTLSHFSMVSTSDQTRFAQYPYIVGNMLSAVLPEQAAVWSYPVDIYDKDGIPFSPTEEYAEKHISEEQVIMNMVNSILGRMHLASRIWLLSNDKQALIKEGVDYYKSLTNVKKQAVPYMPLGFTHFGEKLVASGFKTQEKLYLAVWNLGGEKNISIDLKEANAHRASIVYPKSKKLPFFLQDNRLCIQFTQTLQARIFEIDLA